MKTPKNQAIDRSRRDNPTLKTNQTRRLRSSHSLFVSIPATSDEWNQSMPTNADVFTTILSEVTGKPKSDVAGLLQAFRESNPGKNNFDAEISQQQYDTLLAQLRTEKSGIINWLIGKGLHKP